MQYIISLFEIRTDTLLINPFAEGCNFPNNIFEDILYAVYSNDILLQLLQLSLSSLLCGGIMMALSSHSFGSSSFFHIFDTTSIFLDVVPRRFSAGIPSIPICQVVDNLFDFFRGYIRLLPILLYGLSTTALVSLVLR